MAYDEDWRSLLRADLARYPSAAWLRERSVWAVLSYRITRALHGWIEDQAMLPAPIQRALAAPIHIASRLVEAFTGVELPPETRVGPGLRIWHGGNIVIHPDACIGRDCTLRHGVTIGNREPGGPAPVIGNNVDFGAYAQLLGEITIGDNARIGAMALVLQNVPTRATAVGNPARIIVEPAGSVIESHAGSQPNIES